MAHTHTQIYLDNSVALDLIQEVKKRPCIWNPEDENYNYKPQTMAAWMDIAHILQQPEALIKTKWKVLRDSYNRQLKKCSLKTWSSDRRAWRHFHRMSFLPGNENLNNDTDQTEDQTEETELFDEEFTEEDQNPLPSIVKIEASERRQSEYEAVFDQSQQSNARTRRCDDDDYDMMFLKSLTPYFKELDPLRKLVVRSKIQDIIFYEIGAQNKAKKGQ